MTILDPAYEIDDIKSVDREKWVLKVLVVFSMRAG